LGEGNTLCIPSARHGGRLLFKLELCNPTGSYKDRFAAAEVARLRAKGYRRVLATSSGNTGSSLAAYCARAGMEAVIFVNANAPAGKLVQMRAHGATVVRVPHFAADADVTARVFAALEASGEPLVVSAFRYCPDSMTAVGAIGQELWPLAPQHVFVPIGGGGLLVATSRACAGRRIAVHGVQPLGCPTVLTREFSGSTTRISGLSVPMDIDASLARETLRENGGTAVGVTDEEIFEAHALLLREEGIFAEPAGAAAYAGWRKIQPEGVSVCLVTGSGAKEPASLPLTESPLVPAAAVARWLQNA